MSRSIAALTLASLLGLVACNQSSGSSSGCSKDTDCKGDRICQAGQCVAPPGTAVAPVAPAGVTTVAGVAAAQARAAALQAQIDQSNSKEAQLQAQLAAAKSPAEIAALQAQLDAEKARNAQLQRQANSPSGPGKPCNCTPGDPLCSCL